MKLVGYSALAFFMGAHLAPVDDLPGHKVSIVVI